MNLKCKIKYEGFRPIIRDAAIKSGAMPEVFKDATGAVGPFAYLTERSYFAKDRGSEKCGDSYVFFSDEKLIADAKEVGIEEFLEAVSSFTPPPPPLKIGGHTVSFKDGGIQVGCTFVPGKDVEELYGRWKAWSKSLADQFLEAMEEVYKSRVNGGPASRESIAKLDKLSTSNGGPSLVGNRRGQECGSAFDDWLRSELGSSLSSKWQSACVWRVSCGDRDE